LTIRSSKSFSTQSAQSGPIDFVLRALAAQEKWLERDIRCRRAGGETAIRI
jgi:hypothetical protein